jgi:NADH-quinone oxidoreductase subunit N
LIIEDLLPILPLIAAVLTAAAILVVDLIRPGRDPAAIATALIGLGVTATATIIAGASPATAFGGSYTVDALTTFLDILFIAVVAMTIVFAPDYLLPRSLPVAEFAVVIVFAMTGAMLLAGSSDLRLLFLGLELMVVPGYRLGG